MRKNLCERHTKLGGTVPLKKWKKCVTVHTWKKWGKKRVAVHTNMNKVESRLKRNWETIQDICVTFTQRKLGQFHLENEGGMCASSHNVRIIYDLKGKKGRGCTSRSNNSSIEKLKEMCGCSHMEKVWYSWRRKRKSVSESLQHIHSKFK